MTYEEAIREVREFGLLGTILDLPHNSRALEAFNMVLAATEKQIPIKPKINSIFKNEVDWECPTCGLNIVEEEPCGNYCQRCGQKIDWR